MSAQIIEHESHEAMAKALAAAVARDLNDAIRVAGSALVAVPGGSTPEAFLKALSEEDVRWTEVTVIATDERCVPAEDERSNAGMIRRAMGGKGFLFPFYRAGQTAEEAAALSDSFVAKRPAIRSAVIGMGTDMHCASLFPGAPELEAAMAAEGPMVSAMTPPGGLEPRVTLTARAFAAAGAVRLLIAGKEKKAAIEAALKDRDPLKSPVGAVLRASPNPEIHWAP